MFGNKTVDSKGAKTVLVKTTGHEKSTFTVVLACTADGAKLRPMIIFKRKTMPKIKFSVGVFVHVNEKDWMNEEKVKLWLENVWSRRPGGLRRERSLLVWDMFRAHLTPSTKNDKNKHRCGSYPCQIDIVGTATGCVPKQAI